MFHQLVAWLASTVGSWGYPGIMVLMALVGCGILALSYGQNGADVRGI